jgi:hypothetical protein
MTDLLNPLRTAEYPTLRVSVGTTATAANTSYLPPGCQGIMVVSTVSVFIEIHPTNTATIQSIPVIAGIPMSFVLPTPDSQTYRVSAANLLAVLGAGTPVAGDVLIRPIQRN